MATSLEEYRRSNRGVTPEVIMPAYFNGQDRYEMIECAPIMHRTGQTLTRLSRGWRMRHRTREEAVNHYLHRTDQTIEEFAERWFRDPSSVPK